jgi:AcrR family transcriptional regulator
MSDAEDPSRKSAGLRERKKAKTRAVIQQHALRLFREQGYEETTVEQIAEAAEVSPSTFFRYFPTKEDVVLYDAFDPLLIKSIRRQPAGLGPIAAVRAGFRAVFGAMPADEKARQMERSSLIFRVPDLRMRTLDQVVESIRGFSILLAERMGRPADDPAVRTLVGAALGVGITMMLSAFETGKDPSAAMDEGLALLEKGFPAQA